MHRIASTFLKERNPIRTCEKINLLFCVKVSAPNLGIGIWHLKSCGKGIILSYIVADVGLAFQIIFAALL